MLRNGHFFIDEFEALDVGYPGGAIIYRSYEQYYFEEILIQQSVLEAKSDNNFIIAVQRPPSNTVNEALNYYIIEKNLAKFQS